MAGKQIKGITIEIDGDTSKLGKALSDVEKRSRETNSSLKDIEKNLKFNPGNTELVAQQQRKLQDAISETKEKLQILKTADEQAKKQLANGEIGQDKYDALQREIIATENYLVSYEKRLNSSKNEQEKFEKATGSIATVLEKSGRSIDDFSEILGDDLVEAYKKGEGSSEQMEKALDKLGQELLGTGGDAQKLEERLNQLDDDVSFEQIVNQAKDAGDQFGVLGTEVKSAKDDVDNFNDTSVSIQGINAVIDLFGKFKDTVANAISSIQKAWSELDEGLDIITAKTGATGEASEKMGKVFNNVYSDMPVKADAVGNAIGELNTQFGLQDKALEEATRLMLKYSEINGADVTQSTIDAKKAMSQYNLEADSLSSVLDVVSKTAQNTGASTDSLLGTVTESAPILQGMNLNFEESVTLIGEFEKNGINGSKALGYLTRAQAAAAKNGETLNQTLNEFTKYAQSGASETDKLNKASELFGTKGGAMMLKMAQEGSLNLEDLKNKVSESGGTVSTTYKAMLDPADKWTVAQNNIKIAMSEVSNVAQEALAPALEFIVNIISDGVNWLTGLDDTTKTIIITIAGLVVGLTIVASIIAAVSLAFSILAPIFAVISGGFAAVGSALSGLGAFIIANPIVLIIAAIVAAVVLLIKNWDWVKEQAANLWNKIKEIWEGIKTTISNVWDNITTGVSTAVNTVKETVGSVFEGIKNTASTIWEGIKDAIWRPIQWAKDKVSGIVEGIKGIFSFKFEWPHIPLPHFSIEGSWNPIDWITEGVPSISIDWYAKGGIFDKPSIIGVGERGSEAVVPTDKLDRFFEKSLNKANIGVDIGRENSVQTLTINIEKMEVRDDLDIQRIAEELHKLMIRKGRRLN